VKENLFRVGMWDLKNEKTFVLREITGKNIIQVKEEIIRAAIKRKDYGDTVMMVNLSLEEIYITTTSDSFLKHIISNRDYIVKTRISKVNTLFKRKSRDSEV
jgi:hypothetical protein